MSTGLYVTIAAILLFVILIQIARATELVTFIKGEDRSEDTSKFQAILSMLFLIFGFIGIVWSHYLYQDRLLGPSASELGQLVDDNFNITLFFTAIIFVITQIALFWCTYKYRERKGQKAEYMPGSAKVEAIWTIIPAIVLTYLVVNGVVAWYKITGPSPEGAIHVEAIGKQFEWILRHPGPDGKLGAQHFSKVNRFNQIGLDLTDPAAQDDAIVNDFQFPLNADVEVRIQAMDVLHSFGLPHFRTKLDAVPGTPTRVKFKPIISTDSMQKILGNPDFDYVIACQELCGKGHNSMKKYIKIIDDASYEAWVKAQVPYSQIIKEAMAAEGVSDEELAQEMADAKMRRESKITKEHHGDDHGDEHEDDHGDDHGGGDHH